MKLKRGLTIVPNLRMRAINIDMGWDSCMGGDGYTQGDQGEVMRYV